MAYGKGDELDQANLEIEGTLKAGIAKAKDRLLAKPQKIKGNTILCSQCEIVIPKDRLKALPTTNVCIACAKLEETNNV